MTILSFARHHSFASTVLLFPRTVSLALRRGKERHARLRIEDDEAEEKSRLTCHEQLIARYYVATSVKANIIREETGSINCNIIAI
jgi:hypothetical protein